jgi:hypothetical protein
MKVFTEKQLMAHLMKQSYKAECHKILREVESILETCLEQDDEGIPTEEPFDACLMILRSVKGKIKAKIPWNTPRFGETIPKSKRKVRGYAK